MDKNQINAPHGGHLKNLVVDEKRAATLKALSLRLPDITLSDHQLCDLELLAMGAFSPLDGFMVRADYESVLDRMRLQDNTLWPLPVCLDISKEKANSLEVGQSVTLRDPEGFLLAIMHIDDIWQADKAYEVNHMYQGSQIHHPGVHHLNHHVQSHYIGGPIEVIHLPLHYDFKQLRRTPAEIRQECRKLGWQRIVGYQTGGLIHRPQFEITLEAMQRAKANLLLLPIVGLMRTEEFDYYTRVRCYMALKRHYPPDTHLVSLLPHFLRLAGYREIILNALVSKNFGCTHFVVCANQADPLENAGSLCFDDNTEIQQMEQIEHQDIGIKLLQFKELVYQPFEDKYQYVDQVADGVDSVEMSSSDIRKRIRSGRKVPEWASFPEVLEELRRSYPPPSKQGFTIFCTGLSGAGKSTIAKVLFSKMLEIGDRPVTLLDGDIVRHNLSSELTFSKEHRDINVRRIGFVASEITKNRGIAICAPIAPYERTRSEIRQSIEAHGGFIEVHVATPLSECEQRDRKGMYAKARAGLIKGYTGIDDPYEEPQRPELRIDTTNMTPDEAAHQILLYLGQVGYI